MVFVAPDFLGFDSLAARERRALLDRISVGVDRRSLLQYLGGLGLSLGASIPVITSAEKVLADTPKKGGTLTVAHSAHGPGDTLDPIRNTATIDYLRGRMIYGSLVRLSDRLIPEPELAVSFEPNADATEWTFELRKGVEFHDGAPFGADDVIFSMNRHLGDDTDSLAKTLMEGVLEWRKIDDFTVRAVLATPNVDFAAILGTFHFKIVQRNTTDFSKPAGTGPFRMEVFEPGVRTIATAFENYWGDGPYVDAIEYFAITEDVRRVNALVTGEVDIIGDLPSNAVRQVEAARDLQIWSVESGAYYDIALRSDIAPGSDSELVLAMKYLFNREALVETILGGRGDPGNDHPIGPAYAEHCTDIPLRPFDPDRALYHLKNSGLGGQAIEIQAAEVGPGLIDMCLLLQREAGRIGLNIEVQKVSTDGYWRSVWLSAPVFVAAWNMRPTANAMLSIAYQSDAAWNESRWQNQQFDQLLIASRAERSEASRRQMYCDMQQLIHSEAGTIIPLHRAYVGAHENAVKGLTNSPLAPLGGCEWPEFVWIDA